jgi:hypothetical protein
MEIKEIEENILIATRVKGGDTWRLKMDGDNGPIYKSLTDTLQAYFDQSEFRGSYRLDPLDSKLYAIQTKEIEIPVEQPKTYSFYGDNFRQGI